MIVFPKPPLQKTDIKPLNTRRLLMLYLSYVQTRTTDIDDIICTGIKLLEAAFLLAYPDPRLWLDT